MLGPLFCYQTIKMFTPYQTKCILLPIMIRRFWFYRFYTLGDFIKGTILQIVLNLCLVPFYLFGIAFVKYGPSYSYLIITIGITLVNLGVYIYAIVRWRLMVKGKIVEVPYV